MINGYPFAEFSGHIAPRVSGAGLEEDGFHEHSGAEFGRGGGRSFDGADERLNGFQSSSLTIKRQDKTESFMAKHQSCRFEFSLSISSFRNFATPPWFVAKSLLLPRTLSVSGACLFVSCFLPIEVDHLGEEPRYLNFVFSVGGFPPFVIKAFCLAPDFHRFPFYFPPFFAVFLHCGAYREEGVGDEAK